jgi:hypothetical protein
MGFTKWLLSSLGIDTTTEEDIIKKYPSYFNVETAKEALKRRRVQIVTTTNANKVSYDHVVHIDNVKAAVEKGVLPVYYLGKVVGTFNVHTHFNVSGEGHCLCGELGLNKNVEFEQGDFNQLVVGYTTADTTQFQTQGIFWVDTKLGGRESRSLTMAGQDMDAFYSLDVGFMTLSPQKTTFQVYGLSADVIYRIKFPADVTEFTLTLSV